ncbi:DNA helicase [Tanacetum coccineum]
MAAAKGKMIAIEPEVSDIAALKPGDSNKIIEAIVYRKWVSKNTQTQQPIRFCCILMDKQGTPIQANMDAKDTEYFDQLLELHAAYRIASFNCEHTLPWERTLDNPTSLTFRKFISLQEIPNNDFPEKLHIRNPVLTGLPREMSHQTESIKGLLTSKILEILTSKRYTIMNSENIIGLTLWHEMALNFNLREYEAMEKPVVIPVSSCWRYQDLEQEKNRNRFPLATLLEVDPENYQNVRFTTQAILYKINSLKKCYCFKAIIGDGLATISLTCFSNQANSLTRDYTEVLADLPDKNPYQLPQNLKSLEDKVFKDTILPLPAPPIQHALHEPTFTEQPERTEPQ